MVKLIQAVLTNYVPVPLIRDHRDTLTLIPHTDRHKQLNDIELFISTDARVILTSLEDDTAQERIREFLRYCRLLSSIVLCSPGPTSFASWSLLIMNQFFIKCMKYW